MNQKSIYCDIASIKKVGLDIYLKNYFWPVGEEEYRKFLNKIYSIYFDLVFNIKDKKLLNIALIESSFIQNYLEQILHFNYVKEFAKENKMNLISKDSEQLLFPNWEEISKIYRKYIRPASKSKVFFRRIVRNFLFNLHLGPIKLVKGFFNDSPTVGFGYFDNLKSDFLKKDKLFCDNRDWNEFIKFNKMDEKTIEENLKDLSEVLIDPYIDKLKNMETLFVKNLDFELLKKSWKLRFADLINLYDSFGFKKLPKTILVTSAAKPISKLIVIKSQDLGINAYGIHHGNDLGYKIYKNGQLTERSHCKHFLVPTKGIAEQFKVNYSNGILEKKTKTKYISVDTIYYFNIFNKDKLETNHDSKSAMLIGAPMNIFRYTAELGQFFYFKLALEFQIIQCLKKNNFKIVYKVHPDRKKEIEGLFEKYVDEYIVTPFEKIWKKYDNYIFTDTASTLFGFAVSTKKNIILMENNFEIKNHNVEKYINSRVYKIPTSFDENMKFSFDENNLISSLNSKDIKDYSIINSHLS